MASKWKLTKTDEKEIQAKKEEMLQQCLEEGKDKATADAEAQAYAEQLSKEKKQQKHLASLAKKNQHQQPAPAGVAAAARPQRLADVDSYWAALQQARTTVLAKFPGIISADPLVIDADNNRTTGVQAVFDAEQAEVALSREGCYLSAGNFFWVDHLSTLCPEVPLSTKRVQQLAKFLFDKGPVHFPFMLHVGVSASKDFLNKGNLLRLSPEEYGHAALFAAAACDDPEELDQWRKVFLSVPFRFERLGDSADFAYWRSWELRQMASASDDAVRRSARQLICEIHGFKSAKEAQGTSVSLADMQAMYSKATTAGTNAIAEGLIKEALYIYDRAFKNAVVTDVIAWFDDSFGKDSCLNSVSKLKALCEKCVSDEEREWTFLALKDAVSNGSLLNENITRTALLGSHHPGLIESMKFRRKAMTYLLDVECPKMGLNLEALSIVKQRLISHLAYRQALEHVGWMGALSESAVLAFRLLEDAELLFRWLGTWPMPGTCRKQTFQFKQQDNH